ncbi:MAG: SOS response-associated peptidase [Candidatus Thorarchaeota archaeon]
MCGRFNFLTHKKAVQERYGVTDIDFDIVPRYNISPNQKIATVIQDPNLRMVEMRWGFIPHWAKDQKIGYKMINSRAEKVASSRVFKSSFQKKRCLIPATGFYEWQKVGKVKKPMHIRFRSRNIFSMAGIYSRWKSPKDTVVLSCSILTTEPNDLLESIHNRMPVILPREEEAQWLSPDLQDIEVLQDLLVPYKEEGMEAYEVSTYVNSPNNAGPMCTMPVQETLI